MLTDERRKEIEEMKEIERKGAESMIAQMSSARPYLIPLPKCPYHGMEMEEITVSFMPPWDNKAGDMKVWACRKCAENDC